MASNACGFAVLNFREWMGVAIANSVTANILATLRSLRYIRALPVHSLRASRAMDETPPSERIDPVDSGCLPAWRQADLPAPLPFSTVNVLRTIGPGAILLAGAIGGGEWIVGPLMAVKYGPSILWIATAGIVLQTIFNLEAIRYTLYTGEPILTGVLR